MKVGIIGAGVVGQATGKGLARGNEIVYYDPFKCEYDGTLEQISECQVVFVCVPTPMKKSGEINLEYIEDTVELLSLILRDGSIVVIKSTAVSGTTSELIEKYKNLAFSFNPEFLTEANAEQDFIDSNRVIIGADDTYVFENVAHVYSEAGFTCPIIQVDVKTAEMIKYVGNTFLATKVMFANEIYNICKKLEINYNDIVKNVILDERIGNTHWDVPGKDGDFGFGGKCFPKDINALIYKAREKGYRPHILEEVWRSNLVVREKIDWLDQIQGE